MIAPVYGPDVMDITKDNWYTTDFGLTRVLGELARLGTQFVPKFQQLKDALKGEQFNITLRKYAPDDLNEITELFYNTVHSVNAADYSKEQLDVWATGQVDMEAWNKSLLSHYSVVALIDETIVGFGDIDDTGYLDRLYVHRIITHASITAKSFFERRGYKVVNEQQVIREGTHLTNYVMEKWW